MIAICFANGTISYVSDVLSYDLLLLCLFQQICLKCTLDLRLIETSAYQHVTHLTLPWPGSHSLDVSSANVFYNLHDDEISGLAPFAIASITDQCQVLQRFLAKLWFWNDVNLTLKRNFVVHNVKRKVITFDNKVVPWRLFDVY